MREWRPLPEELDLDLRALVMRLRRMKDSSELSLAALAERTRYSKSAWERYLNGKTLPPRGAVHALGRLAAEDLAALTALWEMAQEAWYRPQSPDPDPGPDPGLNEATAATGADEVTSRHRHPVRSAAWLAGILIAVTAVMAAWTMASGHSGGSTPALHGTAGAPSHGEAANLDTRCYADGCAGLDPKDTGCAGDAWTAALTRVNQVYVELRYSRACRAAWARISWGRPGDVAEAVPKQGTSRREPVHYDTDVYTAMVPASDPAEAKACTLLLSGRRGCTHQGGHRRLLEPPEPPST